MGGRSSSSASSSSKTKQKTEQVQILLGDSTLTQDLSGFLGKPSLNIGSTITGKTITNTSTNNKKIDFRPKAGNEASSSNDSSSSARADGMRASLGLGLKTPFGDKGLIEDLTSGGGGGSNGGNTGGYAGGDNIGDVTSNTGGATSGTSGFIARGVLNDGSGDNMLKMAGLGVAGAIGIALLAKGKGRKK